MHGDSGTVQDLGVGSHVPILAAAIVRTKGPILECGCGWWSTPLIHMAAMDYDGKARLVVSCESDPEWLSKFVRYQTPRHRFVYVPREKDEPLSRSIESWKNHPILASEQWGVAFVDNSPGEARIHIIQKLKGHATYIVTHDTEADIRPSAGDYKWALLDGVFKHQTIFKDVRPWTTVYSDVEDFKL